MARKRFSLVARVDTDSPVPIRRVLQEIITAGTVARGAGPNEFVVRADLQGESARALNRSLLSELRRVEKKTRLRAQWTSADGVVSRFFDYVPKKTSES